MFLSNFIAFILVIIFQKFINNNTYLDLSYISIFTLVSILISFTFKSLLKKLKMSYLSINKTYLTIISIVLILSFIILYIYSQVPKVNNASLKIYGLILLE